MLETWNWTISPGLKFYSVEFAGSMSTYKLP